MSTIFQLNFFKKDKQAGRSRSTDNREDWVLEAVQRTAQEPRRASTARKSRRFYPAL